MKNPIPYTKEDIYLIVEMAIDLDRTHSEFADGKAGFARAYVPHKKLIDELVLALSPEEREDNYAVKFYMEYIYKEVE